LEDGGSLWANFIVHLKGEALERARGAVCDVGWRNPATLAEPKFLVSYPAASGADQMKRRCFATAAWPQYPELSKKKKQLPLGGFVQDPYRTFFR